MAKVEIIGPKSDFLDVVTMLHEQGSLHIEDLSQRIQSGDMPVDRMDMAGEQTQSYDRLDELLIRVRAILKTLPSPEHGVDERLRSAEYARLWSMTSEEFGTHIEDEIGDIEVETAELAQLHAQIETEAAVLSRYEPILDKIQPLAKQLVLTGSFETVALLVERRYKAGLEHLKTELDKLTNKQCEIISADVDEEHTAAIVVFGRQYTDAVHKFLSMENVNQIRLPADFQDMPLDVAYKEIKERRSVMPAELERVSSKLDSLSAEWYVKLSAARDVLLDRIDEIIAIPKFGKTDYAFIITGWTPASDVKALTASLQDRFHGEVMVTQKEITDAEMENTPVALRNTRYAAPFQGLLGFMGTPRYGTVDPTWMLAIFYPLFFGMIVGDIGYGLIMLGTVLWLRTKYAGNSGVQMATSILGPAATSVIIFGFIYGEFFGNVLGENFLNVIIPIYSLNGQIAFGSPVPEGATQLLPFAREEMIMPFLAITLFVGIAQVMLGLALGVYNGIKMKHKSHVYEKGGILAFVIGFIGLIATVIGASYLQGAALWIQAVMGLLIVFGLGFAIKGGKILGAIESIGALTNIASYLRIMAVGLAGAIFANAANEIAKEIGNPVVGLIIVIPLQALNFIIAAFSPNIHAVRLNFLEFFGKFYETSDKEYKPFHKTGGEKSA